MWNTWFSRNRPPDSPRPSLRDVTFETSGLRIEEKAPDRIEWVDLQNDRYVAWIDRAAPDRPLVPWTLDALRAYWRRTAAERNGGIVSVTFGRANAISIGKAIVKFAEGPGYLYEGSLMIRFRQALYTVTLVAREHFMTGRREAITTGLLLSLGELTVPIMVPPTTPAPLEGFMRDPYDDTYDGPTLYSLADDERVDELIPNHPLVKVRRWLASLEETLAVAPDLHDDLVLPPPVLPSENEPRHRMPAYALGVLYLQAGRLDAAERLLAEAVPLQNNEPVLDAPRVGNVLTLLGMARESLDRPDAAAWALEWAVRAFCATAGEREAETIRAKSNLGRVYVTLGRHEEAETLLTESLSLFEAQQDDAELAVAANALGLVRQAHNRHSEALALFERALALFERIRGADDFECAGVLRNLARSADALGDHVGSRRALKRAAKIGQPERS